MLADYSSYIELLAAVYTSMFIDVKPFRDLWLPRGYKEHLEAALTKHKMAGDEELRKTVLSAMDETIAGQIKEMKGQAVTMFALSALSLVFLGHESVLEAAKDIQITRYYESYVVTLLVLYGTAFTFWSGYFFGRWRRTITVIVSGIAIFLILYNVDSIPLSFLKDYEAYFAPVALILLSIPALVRMFKNRLYLIVYSRYLKLALRLENKDYEQAQQALRQQNPDLMPERYYNKLTTEIFTAQEKFDAGDTCLQGAIEFHQEKLLNLAKMPNVVKMICYVGWHWIRINIQKSWACLCSLFTHRSPSQVVINYADVYDLYLFAKTKNGDAYTMEAFCADRNIDYKFMKKWCKENLKKT